MEFESGARAELTDIAEIEIASNVAAGKRHRAQPRFRRHWDADLSRSVSASLLHHGLIASIFSE
jgi:hypothetical protein